MEKETVAVGNVPKSPRLFTYTIITSEEEKLSELIKLSVRPNSLSLAAVNTEQTLCWFIIIQTALEVYPWDYQSCVSPHCSGCLLRQCKHEYTAFWHISPALDKTTYTHQLIRVPPVVNSILVNTLLRSS